MAGAYGAGPACGDIKQFYRRDEERAWASAVTGDKWEVKQGSILVPACRAVVSQGPPAQVGPALPHVL